MVHPNRTPAIDQINGGTRLIRCHVTAPHPLYGGTGPVPDALTPQPLTRADIIATVLDIAQALEELAPRSVDTAAWSNMLWAAKRMRQLAAQLEAR